VHTKLNLLVIISMILVAAIGVPAPRARGPDAAEAYIEPGLAAGASESLSVIVTATDAASAARAVERVGGQVSSELWLIDAVAATVPMDRLTALATTPGVRAIVNNKGVTATGKPAPKDKTDTTTTDDQAAEPEPDAGAWDGWVTDFRFPVPYDGRPDVEPTTVWWSPHVVTILPVDIGTDSLMGLLGNGITVAVVDSGAFFDEQVQSEMGRHLAKLFVGQADFVDEVCDTYLSRNGRTTFTAGTQNDGYCFSGAEYSKDGHGHGSHVAGIIWSHIHDQDTGAFLGIAPNANILSVRVLGDDGFGTYADVIKGIQYVVANKDTLNVRVLNLSLSAQATTPYFVDPLNRAVEEAWAAGIVVVAAAGNEGPEPETITVPGNDPYMITVGAVDSLRTTGY
jgi:hypothetical protein